jgi:hypothetical protein
MNSIRSAAGIVGVAILSLGLPANSQTAPAEACNPTLAPRASGPQVSDIGFRANVSAPAFAHGAGPTVHLDEAHNNFHTISGRYAAFAELLRNDGFAVLPFKGQFTKDSLASVEILVIANALSEKNTAGNSQLPTYPAFSEEEIAAVRSWVGDGGALLLIADHMPWPGAAAGLARQFGIVMTNSYATDSACAADEYLFSRDDHTLANHAITRGRHESERIEFVRTFTGQAFWSVTAVEPLLRVPEGSILLLPVKPWEFSIATPQLPGDGLLQGAVLKYHDGRVAVFGEAAMFSAQVSGAERRPMGMNMPSAARNPQFLLNVMHWLAGILAES